VTSRRQEDRSAASSFRLRHARPHPARAAPKCVSHRGYHQCELIFEDCRVPPRSLLGEHRQRLRSDGPVAGLDHQAAGRATTSVGRGPRACSKWRRVGRQRASSSGRRSGKFQGTGLQARRHEDRTGSRRTADVSRAAWKDDQGTMTDTDAAMAKLFASEALARVDRQRAADLRRHGADERAAHRALLARCAGRADAGTAPARSSATSSAARCCARWRHDAPDRRG